MARFMTRIELHHSDDYTQLHAAMLNRGFAKIIKDDETGIWYNLPEAEYHCTSQLSLSEVQEIASEVAEGVVGTNFSSITTQSNGILWTNLTIFRP